MPQNWDKEAFERSRRSVPERPRANPKLLAFAVIVAAVALLAAADHFGLLPPM